MIYDICTFNNEHELFEIRYNILKDFVDEFRVIEFDKTFSGKNKEKLFPNQILNQNYPKAKHYFVTEQEWGKYWEEAKKSPNTNYGEGAKHWIREWCMKESIKDYLTDLNDDDILFIGDCDELPDVQKYMKIKYGNDIATNEVFKIKLRVYIYWLNNKSSEQFWGTIAGKYKNIKGKCLNHLRQNDSIKTIAEWGWHFTSLAPYLKQKLQDSYTEESYATKEVLNNLEDNIKNNRDFLNRDFIYKIDENELPKYLLDNRIRYKHLFKENE